MEDVLKKLNEEENTYKLSMLLEKIAQGEIEIEDCSQIIKFINDKRTSVRHSAIEALRACIRFEEDYEEIHELFDFLFDIEKEWIIKNINSL